MGDGEGRDVGREGEYVGGGWADHEEVGVELRVTRRGGVCLMFVRQCD